MKLVIQRVTQASVSVNQKTIAKIGFGLLILVGVGKNESLKKAQKAAEKILNLRIFADKNDKMNLSVLDMSGEILVVPQFTLLADLGKGRRPYFGQAASPREGQKIIRNFVKTLKKSNLDIKEGKFGAQMKVTLTNNGPVTIIYEE